MTALTIAVLGYGNVGSALASGFLAAGHRVILATRADNPDGAQQTRDANPALSAAEIAEAAAAVADADAVVLALPYATLDSALPPLADVLAGRTIIDATNPVAAGLTHGGNGTSGAQHVAELVPGASVVKAFNSYGFENLGTAPTTAEGIKPAMLYAGDDAASKAQVGELLESLGWDPVDAGPLSAAIDLEHLALLWIRMVRAGGGNPRLLWAAVTGRP